MPTNPITRTDIIRVSQSPAPVKNDYGDLIFQDTNGNEYKIGNKRAALHTMIRAGFSVKLGFAVYGEKEYIATVSLTDVPQPAPKQATPQKEAPPPPSVYPRAAPPISGAEKGLTLKETGDNFRVKLFTPEDQPELWAWYKSELARVSGVKVL